MARTGQIFERSLTFFWASPLSGGLGRCFFAPGRTGWPRRHGFLQVIFWEEYKQDFVSHSVSNVFDLVKGGRRSFGDLDSFR